MAHIVDTRPWHLSTQCPLCSKPLSVRIARISGERFLGCTGYPRCTHAENYDDALGEFLEWYAASMSLDILNLIKIAHPDRWPGNPLAHEITAALNAFREKVMEFLEGEKRL